jgi:tRNA threonylcarbamoyladenosine biosynthesis protein TsaB
MKILALETSGFSGEIALLEEDAVVATVTLDDRQRTAQALAPGMAAALAEAGWRPSDIALVAVTIGPGSFTGLRVGVTTAKTFAYAAGCEVLGVNTLAAIAAQVSIGEQRALATVLDAQRGDLFANQFEIADGYWRALAPPEIVPAEVFLDALPPETLLTGSGLAKWRDRLAGRAVAPEAVWQPRAVTVGQLAWRDYQAGRRDDLWTLAPHYLRASAAEEKAANAAAQAREAGG